MNPLRPILAFLKSITVGVFKDKKLSAGRKANILLDIVLVVPFVLVWFACNQVLIFLSFLLMVVFSGWCLAKVR